jgi:hypothetical protein
VSADKSLFEAKEFYKIENESFKMKISVNCFKHIWKVYFSCFLFHVLNTKWIYFIAYLTCVKILPVVCHYNFIESTKHLNENSTVLHPSVNTSQTLLSTFSTIEEKLKILPWWCTCSLGTQEEVEVCQYLLNNQSD